MREAFEVRGQEFGAQVLVSAKFLNQQADENRTELVKRALTHSLVDYLVVNGLQAINTGSEADASDKAMRGAVEVNVWGKAIPELTLLALTATQSKRQEALAGAILQVNDISWWKFLWLKLKGRQLVGLSAHSS